MPHQCLACGHLIPDEEAVRVLRGCQECKGTRFYYTETPMTADERADVTRRAQQDLREVVTEMLQKEAPDAMADGKDWAELRPRDVRKLVREVQRRHGEAAEATAKDGGWEYEDATPLGIDNSERRDRVMGELAARAAQVKPDTVDAGDGHYDIDVKALLEKNPIVVHRDGAYMIHLPSLFDQKE